MVKKIWKLFCKVYLAAMLGEGDVERERDRVIERREERGEKSEKRDPKHVERPQER